jgi:TraQ conjugal transfer protein
MNTFKTEKRSFIKRLIFTFSTATLLLIVLTFNSCEKELEIQTDFPFVLEVMPVPKSIGKEETVTIRCEIKAEGNYTGTNYKIRYFQFDGMGKIILGGKTLKPNDLFPLPGTEFILYYVSTSSVTQAFDIWVSDNKGNEHKMSFQFNVRN